MGFKSKLKIFWAEHSDPILFYTIVFVAIILITQGLNQIAKRKKEYNNTVANEETNSITITAQENRNNKELINNFLNACMKGDIQNAYNQLSEECKKEQYPTLTAFKTLYYDKIFNQKRNLEIEIVDNETYKITLYEDMLETGTIENRESIEDYYQIVPGLAEDTLYINARNDIK